LPGIRLPWQGCPGGGSCRRYSVSLIADIFSDVPIIFGHTTTSWKFTIAQITAGCSQAPQHTALKIKLRGSRWPSSSFGPWMKCRRRSAERTLLRCERRPLELQVYQEARRVGNYFGVWDGRFGPRTGTREQMAVFITRARPPFPGRVLWNNRSIHRCSLRPLELQICEEVFGVGITTGMGWTLRADRFCNQSQMAVFLARAFLIL